MGIGLCWLKKEKSIKKSPQFKVDSHVKYFWQKTAKFGTFSLLIYIKSLRKIDIMKYFEIFKFEEHYGEFENLHRQSS